MGKSKRLLFIDSSMNEVNLDEEVDVMLSPEFYTLKKEALPVRYAYQAKRIAPSLFVGMLEEKTLYEYAVFKEKEQWMFIAYDTALIGAFLESKGIALKYLSKLFFAQQSAQMFDKPLLLGGKNALVRVDDTVVIVPQIALDTEQEMLDFDIRFRPKKGITLASTKGSFLTTKQASLLGVLFLFLSILFFIEAQGYKKSSQEIEGELDAVLAQHPSLATQYTRDSILQKYQTLDSSERKKRERIKAVSQLIFKGVELHTLKMDTKAIEVSFICKDNKVLARLEKLAKEAKFDTSLVKGSYTINLKGAL